MNGAFVHFEVESRVINKCTGDACNIPVHDQRPVIASIYYCITQVAPIQQERPFCMEDTKRCVRCKEYKDRGAFSKNASRNDGLHSECKVCNARYRKEHREEMAQYNAQYRKDHLEELMQWHARWQKDNPDKCRAQKHRRRARKLAVGGTHTAEDVRRQMQSQKYKCWWCGAACADKYHVDHLIPLARGGHNNPSNIVISCPHCNDSKGAKTPDEFAGRLL
jgi:5-methylcytosine-specific restriction endonuclease McrA